jgi:hypothetical protein
MLKIARLAMNNDIKLEEIIAKGWFYGFRIQRLKVGYWLVSYN